MRIDEPSKRGDEVRSPGEPPEGRPPRSYGVLGLTVAIVLAIVPIALLVWFCVLVTHLASMP